MKKPVSLLSIALASTCFLASSQISRADNTAVEMIKYLNPVQKKGYLNESQDRIIKHKSFKVTDMPGDKPVFNKELGLFVIIPGDKLSDQEFVESMLAKDEVNGLSALFTWQDLEPQSGTYNWAAIDNILEACKKHNKSLILRVSTCGVDRPGTESDTPKWAYAEGVTNVSYTGRDGKPHLMPIYWDTNYIAKWSNFINELGSRYDKNPAIHSVGITGGGILGGTPIIPNFTENKEDAEKIVTELKKDHDLSQRQLVQDWKYVADLFPHAFPTARLNFDIEPPTNDRKGQNSLDEISDYLLYRYGARIYLTRQNVKNAKHGFDDWRVLLKFKPDTITGYQLTDAITAQDLAKLPKFALDDGISFAEIPAALINSTDSTVKTALDNMAAHMGFQLVSEKVGLPQGLKAGEPLKASFTFRNYGAATAKRPHRELDKDIASSYKVELELRDANGKPVARIRHTPSVPTNQWQPGKPITWEEELKMPQLASGKYDVFMSLIDVDTNRKLQILDAAESKAPTAGETVAIGSIQIN